jgi:hypothetical protein
MQQMAIERQIDLLVDGELGENGRRALLLRLDGEPNGWRRCALAFLEGQAWRESLIPANAVNLAQPAVVQPRLRPSRWRPVGRLAGLAAALALTFATGWAWRGKAAEIPPAIQIVEKEKPVQPASVAASEIETNDLPVPGASPSLVAELVPLNQWRKFGFEAQTQTRMAALKLKDGRQVEVPVQEVMLRFVRGRTY